MHKDKIKWNEQEGNYYFSFYHNGERIFRRSVKWTKSKKHLAAEKLKEICDEIELNNKYITPKSMDDVFDEYIRFKSLSHRQNTINTDKRIYKNHISEYLGSKSIALMKPNDLNKFFEIMISKEYEPGKKYSNNMISKVQSLIQRIFDYAYINDYITKDISRNLPKIKHNRPEKKFNRRYTTIDDVIKVINVLEDPSDKMALTISLYTGMRPSEIFGLNFGDDKGDYFEFDDVYVNETQSMGLTKNGKTRTVAIIKPLRYLLDEYYIWAEKFDYSEDSPLIRIVKRQPKTTIDSHIKQAIKIAEVPTFSWYDLRSTLATNLLISGANPYVVAKNLGHNKTETTDTYAIVSIDEQAEIVNHMLETTEVKEKIKIVD